MASAHLPRGSRSVTGPRHNGWNFDDTHSNVRVLRRTCTFTCVCEGVRLCAGVCGWVCAALCGSFSSHVWPRWPAADIRKARRLEGNARKFEWVIRCRFGIRWVFLKIFDWICVMFGLEIDRIEVISILRYLYIDFYFFHHRNLKNIINIICEIFFSNLNVQF